jgi:hypothetical protein
MFLDVLEIKWENKLAVIKTQLYITMTQTGTWTGWTVRGSNSGGGEIYRTCQDWTWNPHTLLCNWYRDCPGGKK